MMSVKCEQQPCQRSQAEFNETDYQVMGQAFDLHNEMGNLWDEQEYRRRLALKCKAIGLETFEEVRITVSHNGFHKNYFIDLLVNGIVYELKAIADITKSHEAQTLNYLFLANTRHGKIINFRSDSIKWRFVSTSMSVTDRLKYSIRTSSWNPQTKSAQQIPALLENLLDDWGVYLSTNLYKEALCHFIGVRLENENQRFIPLSTDTVIHISGISAQRNSHKNNLQKYLNISKFHELLWVNFDQTRIELSCLHHSA